MLGLQECVKRPQASNLVGLRVALGREREASALTSFEGKGDGLAPAHAVLGSFLTSEL